MQIRTVKVGAIQTNCYIVIDEHSRDALIIDPGAEAEKILDQLKGLKPAAIVFTHGHYDHVEEAHLLKEKLNVPAMAHEAEINMLSHCSSLKPDRLLKDGDIIVVGGIKFEVFNTPGHSQGSVCLYNAEEKVLFSGDTLFAGTWGRTDLPTGSEEEMLRSLKHLLALPPETIVYPGHGRETTIGVEQSVLKHFTK